MRSDELRLSPRAVAINWHTAFSAGDVDEALDQHSTHVELVDLGRELLVRGIGEVAVWMTSWRVAFPDLRIENLRVDDHGASLSATCDLVGTHGGPLCGVTATGRELRLQWSGVQHFSRRGDLTRHFVHYDADALFRQLGVSLPVGFRVAPESPLVQRL